jgi:hypothetical protein
MDRKGSVLAVDVFAPSHWTVEFFLEALENSAWKHGAITILKSYNLNGVVFNLNTINNMHNSFELVRKKKNIFGFDIQSLFIISNPLAIFLAILPLHT